jgi:hypothetical protein
MINFTSVNKYMIKKSHIITIKLFLVVLMLSFSLVSFGQRTTFSQGVIKARATVFGNSWYYYASSKPETRLSPDIDSDDSTSHSANSDLILPAGSRIERAFLAFEKRIGGGSFTSVKLKASGFTSCIILYATIDLSNKSTVYYHQGIWDVTSSVPGNGYGTAVGGGTGGRYFLLDRMPSSTLVPMGSWSIIVVYSKSNSRFRNSIVTDNWKLINNISVASDVNNVAVLACGIVTAVLV